MVLARPVPTTLLWSWLKATPALITPKDTAYLVPGNSKLKANWHFAKAFQVQSKRYDTETMRVRLHLQKRRSGVLSLNFAEILATIKYYLKGLLSRPRNDIYGAKCHAESKFENLTVKFKFSDF